MKRTVPILIAVVVVILSWLLSQGDSNFLFLAGFGAGAGIMMLLTPTPQ